MSMTSVNGSFIKPNEDLRHTPSSMETQVA